MPQEKKWETSQPSRLGGSRNEQTTPLGESHLSHSMTRKASESDIYAAAWATAVLNQSGSPAHPSPPPEQSHSQPGLGSRILSSAQSLARDAMRPSARDMHSLTSRLQDTGKASSSTYSAGSYETSAESSASGAQKQNRLPPNATSNTTSSNVAGETFRTQPTSNGAAQDFNDFTTEMERKMSHNEPLLSLDDPIPFHTTSSRFTASQSRSAGKAPAASTHNTPWATEFSPPTNDVLAALQTQSALAARAMSQPVAFWNDEDPWRTPSAPPTTSPPPLFATDPSHDPRLAVSRAQLADGADVLSLLTSRDFRPADDDTLAAEMQGEIDDNASVDASDLFAGDAAAFGVAGRAALDTALPRPEEHVLDAQRAHNLVPSLEALNADEGGAVEWDALMAEWSSVLGRYQDDVWGPGEGAMVQAAKEEIEEVKRREEGGAVDLEARAKALRRLRALMGQLGGGGEPTG